MIHCIWRIHLGILPRFFQYLMRRHIVSKWGTQIGGHIVSKCKEDEFEGVGITNFGFIEEISDVS